MATDRTVTAKPADGKRLTFGELRAFIGEMDQAGAAESTPIHGRVTFGGHLKEITGHAIRFGDPQERHHAG